MSRRAEAPDRMQRAEGSRLRQGRFLLACLLRAAALADLPPACGSSWSCSVVIFGSATGVRHRSQPAHPALWRVPGRRRAVRPSRPTTSRVPRSSGAATGSRGVASGRDRIEAERSLLRLLAAAAGERRPPAPARGGEFRRDATHRRRSARRGATRSSGCSREAEPTCDVAIIDYGSGNLRSAAKAFERAARESGSTPTIEVTSDPEDVARGRPHRAAGRRRLCRLQAGARRRSRHDRSAGGERQSGAAAVSRHLRRHATDGRARARERRSRRPRLDRGEVERDRAAAIRPSRSRIWAGTRSSVARDRIRCSTASRPARRAPRLFRPLLSSRAGRDRDALVAPPIMAGRSPPSSARDNIAGTQFHPGKEPDARARADRQFPEVERPMILFPAIDLKDGQCVRLRQGEMEQATVFNDDPAAQARRSRSRASSGCTWSISTAPSRAKPVNGEAVEAILDAVHIPVQLGGGIRDLDTIDALARQGHRPRDPRHGGGARSGAGARGGARFSRPDRRRHRRARRQGRHRGLGRDERADARSTWRGASRTPASPPSSTPTSPATACCRHQSRRDRGARPRRVDPGHRERRARLASTI